MQLNANDYPDIDLTPSGADKRPHVVIVGAGFGGLACARAMGGHAVRVTIVDRHNYHLFVPLLYQVATAALSPADIAEPIRKILRRHENIDVVMGEVGGVDVARRRVLIQEAGYVPYDRLVLATGSKYDYFGNEHWAKYAPGLKTVADARQIRASVLLGFERAEMCRDRDRQKALMTSVIVGGGPTGVEMAGAIAELARWSLRRDFRNIDPRSARIILVEAGPRILAPFPEELARYAHASLERMGVEILTDQAVRDIGPEGALIGDEFVRASTMVWGAGVKASPAAQWLGIEADRQGRIPVGKDLAVEGTEDIYSIGDTALTLDDRGEPLPGLAQVATQQGAHLGKSLVAQLERGAAPAAFRFRNRGNTAIVGRNAAIFDFGKRRLKGRFAWMLWALVHVYLLVGFEQRMLVSLQWLWRWITYQSGARLIAYDPSERGRGSQGSEPPG
ncbi:NAD(P)/FAD-dependent oxidoreductase [Pelagerythrobacter marensis]|uniref:NADH:ubiquinone reductase (non-electrogenic) n=1 Tax=Pelagerythrobacter marensis TaxID=543877 RepID=A0ABZ2D4B4_9SPHN